MRLRPTDSAAPRFGQRCVTLGAFACVTAIACGGDDAQGDGSTSGSDSSSDTTGTPPVADDTSTGTTGDASSSDTTSADAGSTEDTGASDALDDDSIARIHDAVEDTLGTGLATGCSIAIWRDGQVIYTEGFGTKDEAGNPVTPATLFQIGSDTKKMTAIALLREVDAGTVDLETTVGELLPTIDLAASPGTFDTLSIHRLLSHQSGLFDYTPWSEAADDDELQLRIAGAFAANEYAMMPPGVAWNYSNPNFSLAGLLVETLTERSWADVVIDDIATPLGMTHTYARRDDMLAADEDDIASGMGVIFEVPSDSYDLIELFTAEASLGWTTPEAHADNAFTRPAGMVWSTASDMATLAGFLIEGNTGVLSDALRVQMQTGQVGLAVGVDPARAGYGYGLMSHQGFGGPQGFRDVRLVRHGGNTLDMTSTFMLLPEQGVAVSVLSNGKDDDMGLVAAVALEEAASGRLPEPSAPPPFVQPPAADLSVYAGSFTETALGDMTLTWSGTDLEIDVPLLTELGAEPDPVLVPLYRDAFQVTIQGEPFDLSIYPGLDATPYQYVVNRDFVFTRTSAAANAAPRATPRHAGVLRFDMPRPLSAPRWRDFTSAR